MTDPILQPVIETLQKEGATENELADTVGGLIRAVTIFMYQQAIETFSNEEMQQIETAPDDKTANKLIATFYAQKIGTTPEKLTQTLLKEFVKKFLKEHGKGID